MSNWQSWVWFPSEISCSKEEILTFLDQTPQRLLSILLQVSSKPTVRCIHLHQTVPKGGGGVTLVYNITKILSYFKMSEYSLHWANEWHADYKLFHFLIVFGAQ